MSAGTHIPETTNEKIRRIYLDNDKLAPKEIFNKLEDSAGENERVPSLSYVQKFCREELFPNYDKMQKELRDSPWNTATLNIEPISPEAIPWLIKLQTSRIKYLSKLITIREAKWFNRFFGLRDDIVIRDSDADNDPELKKIIIPYILAFYAQIYAFREQLDTIANIKNPDYTDMDSHLVELDFNPFNDISFNRTLNEISFTSDKKNYPKIGRFHYSIRISAIYIDYISNSEIFYLHHPLGNPDMSDKSIELYLNILFSLTCKKSFNKFKNRLQKLTYIQKLTFFMGLRKCCNDNPVFKTKNDSICDTDAEKNDKLYSIVSTILKGIQNLPTISEKRSAEFMPEQ
jgi:hypothetical protein